MAESTEKSPKELFGSYLKDNRIFVVDKSSASRARLGKTLVDMGAQASKITLLSDFENALNEMRLHRPKVVLSDYNLGPYSGLDLLQAQRKEFPDSADCIFALVTADSSQSAVARAAEEDVDTFILKPYTIQSFQDTLVSAAVAKLFPSDYIKTIDQGKTYMVKGDLANAVECFDRAMKMHEKPTLACFYRGQARWMEKALEMASGAFQKGLSYDHIHYKCLIGLFDLLMEQKKYREAYGIVKRVIQFFPANPTRLTSVLRLAVVTESFEDIPAYYDLFTGMPTRNDEMVKYMCAALIVSAKYYLQKRRREVAVQLLDQAATSSAGSPKFIRFIVETLADRGLKEEARDFVRRFPAHTQGETDYLSCRYIAEDPFLEVGISIQQGRDLLRQGVRTPAIYRTLIRRTIEAKLNEHADQLISAAQGEYPELRQEFATLRSS